MENISEELLPAMHGGLMNFSLMEISISEGSLEI